MKLFKSSYSGYSDEHLMKLIMHQNDQAAFGQLYDRYARKLTWFCQRMVQSKEHAEDLVHEAFIKIIEQPKAFDADQRFSTWIYTIVSNLCLNSIRNQSNREKLLEENYRVPEAAFSQTGIDAASLKAKINNLFRYLSEKEKAVFVLRFEHELSIKEIAEIITIPEGSVKSCLFYLLKKFDTHLQPFKEK